MLNQNECSSLQCFFRMDRTVGLYFHHQFFVVSLLLNTGVLNTVFYIFHRSENCIDWNVTKNLLVWFVLLSWQITTTFFNRKLNFKMSRLIQVTDYMICIQDFKS